MLRDLSCSSVGGLHCPGPVNARRIAWETVIACGCGQVFLVRLGRRILFATGCCVSVRSSISVSFWLRMPGHGGAGSWSRTGRFCVPWAGRTRAVAPCLLCEDLAVILVLGVGVALALTLARLLLRDFGPLVPRSLLPGLWWRCWSWVARSCSPGPITASVLVPGSWTWLPRLSPAICLPPMGWLGWWVCVCLHFLKWCLYYFMEI